jgi:hypothetical protein
MIAMCFVLARSTWPRATANQRSSVALNWLPAMAHIVETAGLEPAPFCLQSRTLWPFRAESQRVALPATLPRNPPLPAVPRPHLPPFFVSRRIHLCHTQWGKPGGTPSCGGNLGEQRGRPDAGHPSPIADIRNPREPPCQTPRRRRSGSPVGARLRHANRRLGRVVTSPASAVARGSCCCARNEALRGYRSR